MLIRSRFLIGFKLRFFGWGPWRRLFPEFAMPQNLFDYQWFLDKRDDLHLAPAWFDKLTTGLGHFRGSTLRPGSVHRFINRLDKSRPSHPRIAAVRRIRFIHAGGLLRLRHVLHLQAARLDMLILPSNSCEGRLHDTIAARNARPKGNIGRVFIRIKIWYKCLK